MEYSGSLLVGPSFDALQSEAFARAAADAGDHPESVLLIENNEYRKDALQNAWAAEYQPLRLVITGFSGLIEELYESVSGPSSLLDALTRRRLIDRALRQIAHRGILDDANLYRDQFTEIITQLEGEGYDNTEAVEELIDSSDLSEHAGRSMIEAYTEYSNLREDAIDNGTHTLGEAYSTVLAADGSLADHLPHTDVIIVSGFYKLSSHEEALLKQLAEEFTVYTVLPLAKTEGHLASANRVATDAFEAYRNIGYDSEYVAPNDASSESLVAACGRMYSASTDDPGDIAPDNAEWYSAPTPAREVWQAARCIRSDLVDGVLPDEILVVVPGLISYQEHIEDVFGAAGIESVGYASKLLYQTYAGRAMLDLVDLCVHEARTDTLARLATNPVVTLSETRGTANRRAVADLARRLPLLDTERLIEGVDDATAQAITNLIDRSQTVGDASSGEVVDQVRALFAAVELEENLDRIDEDAGTFDAKMEVNSFTRVDRVLDAVNLVCSRFGSDDPIVEVQDALEGVRVPPPRQTNQGVIEIVGPRDAFMKSYSRLYFVGLTEMDFPAEQDRPLFFEQILDGLPQISVTDTRQEARYQFATLLSSAESVYITTPETSFDDEKLLESSILDELRRVSNLTPTADELGNATSEDVQRALRHYRNPDERQAAVDHAAASGAFSQPQADRLLTNAVCAANRADAALSDHDGQLTTSTVEELYSEDDRQPFSPTRLRDYAKCGFAYYMKHVLEIEAPNEYRLEPSGADLGSLVHDVLELFYRDLQETPGSPIDLGDYGRETLDEHLLECTFTVLGDEELPYDDVFYDQWLEQLLAGLASPDTNEYYAANRAHDGEERGLFRRFLDHETARDDTPIHFEVSLDLADTAQGIIEVTGSDGRAVPIGGRIDRVNIQEQDEGTVLGLVHDYKTSDPTTKHTIDGIEFQLPLYTIAARAQLAAEYDEDFDAADGAFYVVDPPTEVREKVSLKQYIERGDGTPADYERFLTDVVPDRVGEIAASIEDGAFQTTVLPPEEAGCRYCDYREICDVRHHQRQVVIQTMDEDGTQGYVPQRARSNSFLDTLGGDDE